MDKSTLTTQIISSEIFKMLTTPEQQKILAALEQSTDAQFFAIQQQFLNTTQELKDIQTAQQNHQQQASQAAKEINESAQEIERITLKNAEAQEKITTDQAAEDLLIEKIQPPTLFQKLRAFLKKLF